MAEASLSEDVGLDHNRGHDGLSFVQYMLAGSVAGMVEHMAMFPVDTVKTRMQMLTSAGGSAHATIFKAVGSILRHEGPLGLYRGIAAMGLGAGPAHAVYFSVYETCKEALGGNRSGHQPLSHAAAGALATVASDAVLTPMDMVKQRLQLRRSPYGGVVDCCRRVMAEEGVRAFYVSYRTTLAMNIPFTAVHFATYEAAKIVQGKQAGGEEEGDDGEAFFMHATSGAAAGALASAITNPLDVVKTRLQCQGVCGSKRFTSGSVIGTMQSIVSEEGPKALLRGIRPRVLFHTPAAAICWTTYESSKQFLQRWNEQNDERR